jgi:CubicO group peptidase (beta-lactamase class C family)
VSYLEVIKPVGTWYNYNNWGYDVAANLIEEVSGQSWVAYVTDNILKPLELDRMFVGMSVPEDNYASGYMPAPDGTLTDVGRPTIANVTVQQDGNGIRTSVGNLL